MTPLSCSHMYVPFHLRSPTDLISLWFVFRTGEEKSWIWQVLSLEPTLKQYCWFRWSLRPVTLPAPGKPLFQIFPSFHKGVLFAKGSGCSYGFLSFCLLKGILWDWNIADLPPPSSPRCFWFSGCTPVKLGHLGEMLEFYLQQRRMWSSHAYVQKGHFVLGDQLQDLLWENLQRHEKN